MARITEFAARNEEFGAHHEEFAVRNMTADCRATVWTTPDGVGGCSPD